MGKTTGFLDYKRKNNLSIPPVERVQNFSEFRMQQNKTDRCEQAARCMNCGVPFCQSGMVLGNSVSGCPLHNLIPEWNDEIYQGNWKEALSRLLKTNNFPEFTGRVCPALCEAACTCGMNEEPVTVHDNELAIIEEGYANGWMKPRIPNIRSGKQVAVVGSGPAGLTVADILNQRGHSIIVLEREDCVGGLLMYGIPNMKLDKNVIRRRTLLMEAEGIQFRTKVNVGVDIPAEKLLEDFDAVVLCCGSKTPRSLQVEVKNTDDKEPSPESQIYRDATCLADGIYYAVDYLSAATKVLIGNHPVPASFLSAKDKNVIIVGGGDTGNDCVGTAIRQGCKSVLQLEMMAKLPDKRMVSNPWPQWPQISKTDYGQEEAIALFGHDPRCYQTTVKAIIKDENGCLCGVQTVKLQKKTEKESGKTVMEPVPGSEDTLPCELLLVAAGFVGCEDYVADAFGICKNGRGNLETEPGHYQTTNPKLFTAGDAHRGQSLVVWAIAEGRSCAKEVDEFLMEYSNIF